MNRLKLSISFSIFFLLVGINFCTSAPPSKQIPRDQVLAKVNGDPVTVGRFYDFVKESKSTSKQAEGKQRTKEEMLHDLIREIILNQKAASLDLSSDSDFVMRRDDHMRKFLLESMYQKEIVDKALASDQEVRDHYEKHKEQDFLIPEKVQVRDLLIRVQADSTQKDYKRKLKKADQSALKKINEFHQRASAGEDFAELCRQYSERGGPDISGNLGFIQKGQNSPEFDSTAFSLKTTKEISNPVRDSLGYHLIQLLDSKEKSYKELDSTLFEGIREYLKREKISESANNFIDSLKNATPFVYNEEILNSSESPSDHNTWVLAFGEGDTIRFELFEAAQSEYKYNLNKDNLTTEEKKDVLINYLALPVILEKVAKQRGYADSVEYQAEKRTFTLEEAKTRVEAERVKKDFPPPAPEEREAYYQAHKIDFPSLGLPIHVYHIVFLDSLKAVEVLNQINQGADFVEMAKKYFPGESEIKDVAYDLGFINQGEMPEKFYQAALKLKEGEVSPPVKTSWGYHIIKMVEKKEKGTSFTDIIPQIERGINLEKGRNHIAEWEKNLFEQGNVWINQKLLQKLELPKPEG